jgi:beta-N-acetylhexosaminidase
MLRSRGQKKSLIVVAVSSPYDFAMDKQIGTYICTFDFTETAMHALVRALFGEFSPQGTLPGTLRKSKKVQSKSRQHWLVEEYDRDRDSRGLDDLIKAVARASAPENQFLETTYAPSFELYNNKIAEAHFVVRNSSTHALYGFAATYFIQDIGIIGSIFVDPSRRNVSIGRSLHKRAIRSLTNRRKCKKIQLGTCFPGVFLGVPVNEGSNRLRSWFSNSGWDTQFPKRLTNMILHDLKGWSYPEGLVQSYQRSGFQFDLVYDAVNVEAVLEFVASTADPEVLELYKFAHAESCGFVRAKGPTGELIATAILARPGSHVSTLMPALISPTEEAISGILAPVVPSTPPQAALVLQSMALMCIKHDRKEFHSKKMVVSWVSRPFMIVAGACANAGSRLSMICTNRFLLWVLRFFRRLSR